MNVSGSLIAARAPTSFPAGNFRSATSGPYIIRFPDKVVWGMGDRTNNVPSARRHGATSKLLLHEFVTEARPGQRYKSLMSLIGPPPPTPGRQQSVCQPLASDVCVKLDSTYRLTGQLPGTGILLGRRQVQRSLSMYCEVPRRIDSSPIYSGHGKPFDVLPDNRFRVLRARLVLVDNYSLLRLVAGLWKLRVDCSPFALEGRLIDTIRFDAGKWWSLVQFEESTCEERDRCEICF